MHIVIPKYKSLMYKQHLPQPERETVVKLSAALITHSSNTVSRAAFLSSLKW